MAAAYLKTVEDFYDAERPETIAEFKRGMMVLGSQLYRASSAIPGAGLGLFADVPLKRGDVFTWYSGAHILHSDRAVLGANDPHLKDYLRSIGVGLREFMLGNYRRAYPATPRRFTLVPYDALDTSFRGDGAGQFMNGRESLDAPGVNVGFIPVYSKLRAVPTNVQRENESDAAFEEREAMRAIDAADALATQYPDEAAIVGVALTDIAPNTELITSYGAGYFQKETQRPRLFVRR